MTAQSASLGQTFTFAKHGRRSPVPWHLPQMTNFKILLVNKIKMCLRGSYDRLGDMRRNPSRFIFAEQLCSGIDSAAASAGPNASPKAKENGRPDHERDHNCVPRRRAPVRHGLGKRQSRELLRGRLLCCASDRPRQGLQHTPYMRTTVNIVSWTNGNEC